MFMADPTINYPTPLPPGFRESEDTPASVSRFVGHGSPEGVVRASPGSRPYLDLDTESVYIKKTGVNTKTGWIQIIG